jgi:uncharacterized FlaG/YvyC family protein
MDVTAVNHPVPVAMAEPVNPPWLVQDREWIQTVKKINASALLGDDRELTFAMDRESRRPVVRLISKQTHQILQQFPPEYVLEVERQLGQEVERMTLSTSTDKGQ